MHPAIPLILDAEQTPAFEFETERVQAMLAEASRLDPETLEPAWVLRLAQRMADVLLQARAFERADKWLGVARTRVSAPLEQLNQRLLEARASLRRGAVDETAVPRIRRQLQQLDAQPAHETRLALLEAEAAVAAGTYLAALEHIAPRLETRDAFANADDLWRAQRLMATCAQARLDFRTARDAFAAAAELGDLHDAPRDRAAALVGQGQCTLGLGDYEGGLACFREARELAPDDGAPGAALTSALLATGDVGAAIRSASEAAVRAARRDDSKGYLQILAAITHLHRLQGTHRQAYEALLGVYGQLLQRFGEAAARPVTQLIDLLRRDLGDEAFEALSAQILAERS